MRQLAVQIRNEVTIFDEAVSKIREISQPSHVIHNLTILDMVYARKPKINRICGECSRSHHLSNNLYVGQIWQMYNEIGGDYHTVVYGLPEYLAQTQLNMEVHISKFTRDTPMRMEIMSHRTFI